MNVITLRIKKALEELEEEEAKLKSDYKRAHRGLKYKWRQTLETTTILMMQERLITRRVELETALKIIAEFEEDT